MIKEFTDQMFNKLKALYDSQKNCLIKILINPLSQPMG